MKQTHWIGILYGLCSVYVSNVRTSDIVNKLQCCTVIAETLALVLVYFRRLTTLQLNGALLLLAYNYEVHVCLITEATGCENL